MDSMFELVRKTVSSVDKVTGETKHYTNYFLQFANGTYVAIKPAFNNDYKTLFVLAKDVTPKGGNV